MVVAEFVKERMMVVIVTTRLAPHIPARMFIVLMVVRESGGQRIAAGWNNR